MPDELFVKRRTSSGSAKGGRRGVLRTIGHAP